MWTCAPCANKFVANYSRERQIGKRSMNVPTRADRDGTRVRRNDGREPSHHPTFRRLHGPRRLVPASCGRSIAAEDFEPDVRFRQVPAFLYGVSPTDPMTLVLVGSLLLIVAVAASYVPARRAAVRVTAMMALRVERTLAFVSKERRRVLRRASEKTSVHRPISTGGAGA